VVKIYRKNPVPSEVRDKLDAMLANPPSRHATDLVWPKYLAKDQKGDTIGFFMPKLPVNSNKLHELLSPSARQRSGITYSIGERLHIAGNLATAVAGVHASPDRAIGDVNDSNIYVTSEGFVRIIDTDSFQISTFRCPVGTPEYTPPELQGIKFADRDRTPNHDAFGLAVLIYLLLADGVHPYVSSKNVSASDPHEQRIKNHQYPPFIDSKSVHLNLVITPHYKKVRRSLPANIRTTFAEAFNDKGRPRPTASEWKGLLADALKNVIICPSGHQKFAEPAACRECLTGTQAATANPAQRFAQQTPIVRALPGSRRLPGGRSNLPGSKRLPGGRSNLPGSKRLPGGRSNLPGSKRLHLDPQTHRIQAGQADRRAILRRFK
jgi:DNA-binding helix-hairpin-helix protein with protein kinase domain